MVPDVKGWCQILTEGMLHCDAFFFFLAFFPPPALKQGCTGLVHQDQLDKLILILMIGRKNEQKQVGV